MWNKMYKKRVDKKKLQWYIEILNNNGKPYL
jgi:hypothetical protein